MFDQEFTTKSLDSANSGADEKRSDNGELGVAEFRELFLNALPTLCEKQADVAATVSRGYLRVLACLPAPGVAAKEAPEESGDRTWYLTAGHKLVLGAADTPDAVNVDKLPRSAPTARQAAQHADSDRDTQH